MSNRADLHMHTIASDGMYSSADNVLMAKEAGLAAIAITDHDTLAGIPEALEAGQAADLCVVPGVEISTAANGKEFHILGYGLSPDDAVLQERLLLLRNVRNRRNEQILANLARMGMPVHMEELELAAGKAPRGDNSIGRPHIAKALVARGYVVDIQEAFERYIGEGKPAFAIPERIIPEEAIAWIHEAGGTAVIAHPGLYSDDEKVLSLLDAGADGLEAFHPDHDSRMELQYAEWAASRGKLATGGSDFHGVRDGTAYHGAIGSRSVDAAIARRLLNKELF